MEDKNSNYLTHYLKKNNYIIMMMLFSLFNAKIMKILPQI